MYSTFVHVDSVLKALISQGRLQNLTEVHLGGSQMQWSDARVHIPGTSTQRRI